MIDLVRMEIGYPDNDTRISIGEHAIVYNDTVSDRKLKTRLHEFSKAAVDKGWTRLVVHTPSADYTIRTNNPHLLSLHGLSNDAEFTFLFPNCPSDSVIDTILGHVKEAIRRITGMITNEESIVRVDALRSQSTRPVRVRDFPFLSIIHNPMISFLRKSSDDLSFHIQASIGCRIEEAIPILLELIRAYKRATPPSRHAKGVDLLEQTVYAIMEIHSQITPRNLALAALFLYYFHTHREPKRAVFITRHLFKEIVQSLTDAEFQDMSRVVLKCRDIVPEFWDADKFLATLRTCADTKYTHQEAMIFVSNYPFDGIHIIFEFRLMHPILARRLNLRYDNLIPSSNNVKTTGK